MIHTLPFQKWAHRRKPLPLTADPSQRRIIILGHLDSQPGNDRILVLFNHRSMPKAFLGLSECDVFEDAEEFGCQVVTGSGSTGGT